MRFAKDKHRKLSGHIPCQNEVVTRSDEETGRNVGVAENEKPSHATSKVKGHKTNPIQFILAYNTFPHVLGLSK